MSHGGGHLGDGSARATRQEEKDQIKLVWKIQDEVENEKMWIPVMQREGTPEGWVPILFR